MKLENTCRCKHSLEFNDAYGKPHEFIVSREYQVDIYPLWYEVYQNGGWDDYIHLEEEQFNKYFIEIN